MKHSLALAGLAVVAVLAGTPLRAQVGDLGWDLDGLAARYGVEVTRRREGDAEIVELRPGGVLIRETRWADGGFQRSSEDRSGQGAVLCPWIIYIELMGGVDVCAPGKYPGLRERLNGAIGAMNAFIVANNPVPVTMEQVEAKVAWLDEFGRGRASLTPWCRSGELEQWATRFFLMPRAEWERSVAELLSVPRPPVENPCPPMAAFQGFLRPMDVQSH